MKRESVIILQRNIGASIDGSIGRNTLSTLFLKLGASKPRADLLGLAASVHMTRFGILDDELTFANFIGQCAHETQGFRFMEEIASGKQYEGRIDLGNIKVGDGVRYKGRGPLQTTGRDNYTIVSREAGMDFVEHPERVAEPDIGMYTSVLFWERRKLNNLIIACNGDIEASIKTSTYKVNGGYRGYDSRIAWVKKVNTLLSK